MRVEGSLLLKQTRLGIDERASHALRRVQCELLFCSLLLLGAQVAVAIAIAVISEAKGKRGGLKQEVLMLFELGSEDLVLEVLVHLRGR